MGDERERESAFSVDDFLGEPPRELSAWRWLWDGDHRFPIRSHRGVLGRLLVFAKRLLHPLVRVPQNDLWERQRVFNLILLERLQSFENLQLESRVGHLEVAVPERMQEVMDHNDALYARLDQKLDLSRRQARDLSTSLGAALAVAETEDSTAKEELIQVQEEQGYLELERLFRGTQAEIGERLGQYLPYLVGDDPTQAGPVLDLGCGRGELLALLRDKGVMAQGIDSSSAMVEQCTELGLVARKADLFAGLAAAEEESLGAVVSFHVIEHLPADSIDRLVRLAWRALRPGGVLILETPNPLSVVVAARNFWLDPTHRRPIHPDSLKLSCRLAGFDPVEQVDLRPFPDAQRLPEVPLQGLPESLAQMADGINRLRDQLDDVLFGFQDYGIVARKPNRP